MAEQLLTIPECAALLSISERTIYRWIKDGDIKPRKKYGVTLIRRCDCKRPEGLDNRGAALLGRRKAGGE